MKKTIYLLLMIAAIFHVKAQSVSPWVIASTGGFFSNANFSVSSTFGEMTMVETFTNGNNFLTQGFQQPFSGNVGISKIIPDNGAYSIYPNPSNGNFMLAYHYASGGTAMFRVFNMLGQEITNSQVKFDKGVNFQDFNLHAPANGIYFLEDSYFFNDGKVLNNVSKINISN